MLGSKLLTTTTFSISGLQWRSLFYRNRMSAVAYSSALGRHVVGGTVNNILYTNNSGTSWDRSTTATSTNGVTGIIYTGSYFIAVAGSLAFARSSDGITWSSTSGSMSFAYDISYTSSYTVVVGTGGQIKVSTNSGSTWGSATSGTSNTLYAIANNGSSQFVAVGLTGTVISSFNQGNSWTTGSVTNSLTLNCVGYNYLLTQWLAGASTGEIVVSSDGLNFTFALYSVGDVVTSIKYGAGLWVATSVNSITGQGYVKTTPDPTTTQWDLRLTSSQALYDVYWDGSLFWAVGSAASIYTSPDGITWTLKNTTTIEDLCGVAWNGSSTSTGTVVAVGGGGTILTSENLKNWTTQTSGTTQRLRAVAWSANLGLFVAVGSNNAIIKSSDGISWTSAAVSPSFLEFNDVIYDIPTAAFWAVGNNSVLQKSTDGNIWTFVSVTGTVIDLKSISSNQTDRLVIAAANSQTYYSTTGGASWVSVAIAGTFYCVRWNGQRFVLSGSGGTIFRSTDGTSWTASTSGVIQPIYALGSDVDSQVGLAGSQEGLISAISSNLAAVSFSSNSQITELDQVPNSMLWVPSFDGRFVAVCQDGQIAVSPPFPSSEYVIVL